MKIALKYIKVFFIVGVGQFLAIWFVSFTTNNYTAETVSTIALFDSAIMFAMAVTSLGIGQYFPRYLIEDNTYVKALNQSRVVRLIGSLVLSLFGLLFFVFDKIEFALVFTLTPILFFGVEYSLYVRNKQVQAAFCSFIRVSGVYLFIFVFTMFFTLNESYIANAYFVFFVVSSLLASLVSIKSLNVSYIPDLNMPTRDVWIGVLKLGGAFFIYSIFKSLLIPISSLSLSEGDVAKLFIFLKLYLLIFSIRRVYVQVAHQWLVNSRKAMLFNLMFIAFSVIFIIFSILLSALYQIDMFQQLLGLKVSNPMLIYFLVVALAVFAVYPTRLLLVGGDKQYMRNLVILSTLAIILIYPAILLGSVEMIIKLIIIFEFFIGISCYISTKKYSKNISEFL